MKTLPVVGSAVAFGVIVMTGVAVVSQVTGLSPGDFTRDLRVLAEDQGAQLPLAAGWVAMLSVMAWATAGGAAIVVSLILPLRRRWLLILAALLFALAADDAFMFHERVGPSLGIPQSVFYAVYAVTAAWLVYYSVRHFSDGSTVALVVAGGALAISIGIDLLVDKEYIFEDGLKLLGALVMMTVAPLALLSVHPTLIKKIPLSDEFVPSKSIPVERIHNDSDSNTSHRSERIASGSRSTHTSARREGRE